MKCFSLFLCSLVVQICSVSSSAAEPDLDKLLGGIPLLSPANERLNNFRFTFRFMWQDTSVNSKCVWNRGATPGLLVTTRESRTPVLFGSNGQVLLFDIADGRIVVNEDSEPTVVVFFSEKTFKAGIGYSTLDKAEFLVDIPSLWTSSKRTGTAERHGPDGWCVTVPSESGKSRSIFYFGGNDSDSLQRVEVRNTGDDSLIISISDIEWNARSQFLWPKMPALDAFPRSLKIVRPEDLAADGNNFAPTILFMRAMYGHFGLQSKEKRELPFIGKIDWNAAQKLNDEVSPELIRLTELPSESKD